MSIFAINYRFSCRFINNEAELLTFFSLFFEITCIFLQNTYICAVFNQFLNLNPVNMNKAELIDAMAAEANLTKADAKRALDAFVSATTKAMKAGDRVALVGFGSFSVSKRAARKGRNPQTGKEINIAAKKVVKFKAGADLTAKVK
jgi:DNA-binding protein HU-beta